MRHGRLIITPDGTVKEEEDLRKMQLAGFVSMIHRLFLLGKICLQSSRKARQKPNITADIRKTGNQYLEFSEQNSPYLGNPATLLDTTECQNFPSLEQANGKHTTRDDTDLGPYACRPDSSPIRGYLLSG